MFWPFCRCHMSEKRTYFHSLATSRFKKTLPLAARAPGVVAAHLCAHEWNSWIRWRCAVDGAGRRARRRNDLISSPFDRASRVLCERFGSAARRQSFENERFSGAAFDTISTSRRRRWVSICQFEDATCVIVHVSCFHLCHWRVNNDCGCERWRQSSYLSSPLRAD